MGLWTTLRNDWKQILIRNNITQQLLSRYFNITIIGKIQLILFRFLTKANSINFLNDLMHGLKIIRVLPSSWTHNSFLSCFLLSETSVMYHEVEYKSHDH